MKLFFVGFVACFVVSFVASFVVEMSVAHAQNTNPPALKVGDVLWYKCDLESARGQWAIAYFPMVIETFHGLATSSDRSSWIGHIAFTYRNRSVRLHGVDFTDTSGFIDGDVKKGFSPVGYSGKDEKRTFEFRQNIDPKTGWPINFELLFNGQSGIYTCQLVEPIGPVH